MKKPNSMQIFTRVATTGTLLAASALLISGCATAVSAPSNGGGINIPTPGIPMPGGGSSGGGSSGGDSSGGGSSGGGMGMPGGSSGGGSSGGGMGMPGGSSGGGSSGGGSSGGGMPGGSAGGGSSGGAGSTMGGQAPIPQAGMPGGGAGGGAAGEACNDGGVSGGGFGGGMGCDGEVAQFPGDPERAEELGKELDKSVGDFDEALGEEQREVSSVGRNTEGFGGGSGKGSGGTISLGEQSAGASGSGGAGGGGGGATGSTETEAGPLDGMSDEELQSRTPDDIDATAYDDIVARQLREAALAEDDPELRERLWEEYRKYKGLK